MGRLQTRWQFWRGMHSHWSFKAVAVMWGVLGTVSIVLPFLPPKWGDRFYSLTYLPRWHWYVWVIGILILVIIAVFEAGHRQVESQKARLTEKDNRSKAVLAFDPRAVKIGVTNTGSGAYFYAPIEIQGLVRGSTRDVFAKWTHGDTIRTWIAKGQSCWLAVARLERGNLMTSQWIIPTVRTDGVVEEVQSIYSSCAASKPIVRAPDIVVSVSVMAEPDLQNGIQTFRVRLRGFDAVDNNSVPPESL